MKTPLRRILHGLFFTVASLVTLAVLFYAEENWRGARAWGAAERGLRARGEPLDIHELIPPSVPDEQNLAMAPLFVRIFRYRLDPKTRQLTFNPNNNATNDAFAMANEMPWGHEHYDHLHPAGLGNWMTGHATDLPRLQTFFRQRKDFPRAPQPQAPADDVLLALTRYAPLLDGLAQAAAERPQTRFPVNWTQHPGWGIALPHYSVLRGAITALNLRATAELALGQTFAARRDLMLALHLRRALEHDPILIANLFDTVCLGVVMQTIWEGLAARQWSADDLDALSGELRDIDLLREYQTGMRGDRAFFAAAWREDLQDMAIARELAADLPVMTGSTRSLLERWFWPCIPYVPRGWYALNSAYASRYFQENAVELVDPGSHRVFLDRCKGVAQKADRIPMRPATFLARVEVPVFATVTVKLAQSQTVVDEAVTACSLEKYYLDHHGYPATLTGLVPTYLDRARNDVIDGAPLRYRRTIDGRYQLYSVGWDGRDGGGVIAWPPDRTWRRTTGTPADDTQKSFPNPVRDAGDWVWQYAPAEPPDPPANKSRLESLP